MRVTHLHIHILFTSSHVGVDEHSEKIAYNSSAIEFMFDIIPNISGVHINELEFNKYVSDIP